MYNLKATDMSKAKPDFIVTASALQQEFEVDEAAASKRYVNMILEVTGKIDTIVPGENNSISVSLITENDFSSIICTFPAIADPSVLKPGEEITLRGGCSGFPDGCSAE